MKLDDMWKVMAFVALTAGATAATAERNWGSTKAERAALLPGDELVPEPATVTTRAVDIAAPAEDVWPWLVQLGQDRAGMYSYDWLENLSGLHIHSADRIHPEWQQLAVGDRVRLVPTGWGPLPSGLALPVARIEPGRSLVLRMAPPDMPWDASAHSDVVRALRSNDAGAARRAVERDIRKTASYLLRSSFFRGVSGPLAALRTA